MNLYVITDGEHIKIGISNNVQSRLSTLQVGNTKKLSLVFSINCKSVQQAQQLEKLFHKRYKAYRVGGEWFNLSPSVVGTDLTFAKDVFPVMLEALDQEKIRQAVLGKMSRKDIESYIEQRWPAPAVVVSPLKTLKPKGLGGTQENWEGMTLEKQIMLVTRMASVDTPEENPEVWSLKRQLEKQQEIEKRNDSVTRWKKAGLK